MTHRERRMLDRQSTSLSQTGRAKNDVDVADDDDVDDVDDDDGVDDVDDDDDVDDVDDDDDVDDVVVAQVGSRPQKSSLCQLNHSVKNL